MSKQAQQQNPPTPQYQGFTMRSTMVENRKVWTIKVTSGTHAGRNATINRDQVPDWIGEHMDLAFDLVTVGRNPQLVAINIQPRVRQQ